MRVLFINFASSKISLIQYIFSKSSWYFYSVFLGDFPLPQISPSREEAGIDFILIFRTDVHGESKLYTPLQVRGNSENSAVLGM